MIHLFAWTRNIKKRHPRQSNWNTTARTARNLIVQRKESPKWLQTRQSMFTECIPLVRGARIWEYVGNHFVLSSSASVCLNNAWLKKTGVSAICVNPLVLQLITDLERINPYVWLQFFHHVQCFLSLHSTFLLILLESSVIKCGL